MLRILESIEQASIQDAWLTIGTYDGVHIGHQEIIRGMAAGARADNAPTVVLTFHPHPAEIVSLQGGPQLLTMPDERAGYLGEAGADVVVIQTFDHSLAMTSAEDFLALLKKHLGFRRLWVGYDFALGHKRAGDIKRLTELEQVYGYQLHVISSIQMGEQIVSSSLIRGMLRQGQVRQAAQALGRWYKLSGEVVKGDERGHSLGFPTANLLVPEQKFIPEAGVYACLASVQGEARPAAVNIGVRPTFDSASVATQIEAYILDFQYDLYGQQVALHFIERLRGEKRFPSVQALIDQIQQDVDQTRELVKAPHLTE